MWGLLVSISALVFAQGARAAAEEAVSAERLRTGLEDLENARKKCEDVRMYAETENWPVLRLKAAEVQATCRSAALRLEKNTALTDARKKLVRVANLMLAIMEAIDTQTVNKEEILKAQRESENKLATTVARIKQESGGT